MYYWPREKCAAMHSIGERAMRYWKGIRYSISREFTGAATRSYFIELNAARSGGRPRGISFLYRIEIRSLEPVPTVNGPRRSYSSSTNSLLTPDSATCNPTVLKYRLLHERSRADVSEGEVY